MLKLICSAAIAAALLSVPVMAQTPDPEYAVPSTDTGKPAEKAKSKARSKAKAKAKTETEATTTTETKTDTPAEPKAKAKSKAKAKTEATTTDTTTEPKAKRTLTKGQAEMHDRQVKCGAEWREAKAAGTLPKGATWPKYWSACNTRLKGQGA